MIAGLRGVLVSTSPCVVEVGGVGFEVQIPEKDRASLTTGEDSFSTYLYVREDRLHLFGFLDARDRELFVRLIEVSGIGPKIAINILGAEPSERIVRAIQNKDTSFLRKLPGLGKKTAERLTMELKDKLAHLGAATTGAVRTGGEVREEALLALVSLGLTNGAAERALEKIDWNSDDASSVESVVRRALKDASTA